jgi:UDPglucose--hexose-1-phosphate uridylyltransferase
MHTRTLTKPDGRALRLYSRRPISETIESPPAAPEGAPANSHMRWHPLRREWVAYAGHRQGRTFLPPAEHNPLAPSDDPHRPSELPVGDYDVAVFDNLFPTFSATATAQPPEIVDTRPANGACEVVVFTQDPSQSLGRLPLSQIELILEVWGERYADLGKREDVRYVMPFENRGVEVGVTLHHPHGQIYAYPFVPPIPAGELSAQLAYKRANGCGLLERLLADEVTDGRRLLYVSDLAIAIVPVCARYAYEVWIAPRRAAQSFADLHAEERAEIARALKTILLKFDRLWDQAFPYVMVVHQAPCDGQDHPEAHVHIEFYPPYRMRGRLKYIAGSELGAGAFTADTLPEAKAEELRAVEVDID